MTTKQTQTEKLKVIFDNYVEEGIIPTLEEWEYKYNFKSFRKLKSNKLPYIYNINHFCKLSNSSPKQVRFFLSNKEKGYTTFNVPKKSGHLREINAPSKKLKVVQRWILDNILYKVDSGNYAHGFIPGKTIKSNAKAHVKQELVLGIDIKDFFPSISFESVYDIFHSVGYTKKVSWVLASLCTYHQTLPQGAPTSPMLANLAALHLDTKIGKYCERRDFQYTRYADDITISGSHKLPMYKQKIINIIEGSGFVVNAEKTRMFSRGSRQKVTGLIVNDKVSIGRKRKKILRAIVHNILMNGPVVENKSNDPFFKEKLFGHLGNANLIEPKFAKPLISALKQVDWKGYDKEVADLKEGKLIIRSLERKSYSTPTSISKAIDSEEAFLKAILDTIADLKHYVEKRRWTEPFWEDAHKPPIPKKETKIQPTLHVFFEVRLKPLGINVVRETHEGIGTLDFKFFITIKETIPLNICTEFKLAHNDQLEHGLTMQLPLYLEASPSKFGIFLVMWFKDEKGVHFDKPTNRDKSEMLEYLIETARKITEDKEFKIESILIDASKKPSASRS